MKTKLWRTTHWLCFVEPVSNHFQNFIISYKLCFYVACFNYYKQLSFSVFLFSYNKKVISEIRRGVACHFRSHLLYSKLLKVTKAQHGRQIPQIRYYSTLFPLPCNASVDFQ